MSELKNTNGHNEFDVTELVWYSNACSYWTDNFDNLSTTDFPFSIPTCPHCGSVGYQIELDEWNKSLAIHNEGSPGYQEFITQLKETCKGSGVLTSDLWDDYKKHKLG